MTYSLPRLGRQALVLAAMLWTAVAVAGCGVNNIPTYEEQAKAAWAEVQNNYKRRADLIPNLVETVKGFATQESKVLVEVVEARAKATSIQLPADILNNPEALKKFEDAQTGLSGALGRLLAVQENYPELKSNANFLKLQDQLEGTENRVSVSRRDYVLAVQQFNTELKTIPGRWWKSLLYPTAKEMATFTAPEAEQSAPKVKF